jgi:hypothetical protein
MAINKTGRVWTVPAADVGVVLDGMTKVNFFSFAGYTAETDDCVVKDRTGRVIWSANGATDLSPVNSERGIGWVEGITADTIDSGTLYVYIE